jgi:sulfide:quinone oxidoreductase
MIKNITRHFAVTGALRPDDFAALATMGFKAVLSNRPDGEQGAPLTSWQEAELAAKAGLGFRHIPVTKQNAFEDVVIDAMTNAAGTLGTPILAHCASGMRSAVAWAAAAARSQPVDCILERLRAAGFDLAAIRDELEAQAARGPSTSVPPALDADCGEPSG